MFRPYGTREIPGVTIATHIAPLAGLPLRKNQNQAALASVVDYSFRTILCGLRQF